MGDVYVTIQQKEDYIEALWSGHITADDVVSAALAYLELVRRTGCPKLLNDKSAITGDWDEANDWLQFEWLPKVMAAGLRYMAHVYSQNMFSRLAARELQERISPKFCMSNFQERQAAERWLASQDHTGAAGMQAARA
ncbi:hypothetical protein H9Q13_06975 [Pontibacter sp. JH31]|uniref:STAS/SEC14 domain-containing protein n=2 Tax=Pontibacter aquaedesilientis TaxID=2766980 RepID=A0ABR7XF46_9BACT|nr:hypothetical protein [Pontibacter aquaedesilientis]